MAYCCSSLLAYCRSSLLLVVEHVPECCVQVLLVVDRVLQALPWESMPCLTQQSVARFRSHLQP